MTDSITEEIISKIQALPEAEAKKVIDVIKSLKLFDTYDTHIRGISHEKVCVPCAVTQDVWTYSLEL